MNLCIHEMDEEFCAYCRSNGSQNQMVYATPGGSVVHRRSNCELLTSGQAAVDAIGGKTGPINLVFRDKYPGRGDCTWCMPRNPIGTCSVKVGDEMFAGQILNVRRTQFGYFVYLVRYELPDGRISEQQFNASALIDLIMDKDG